MSVEYVLYLNSQQPLEDALSRFVRHAHEPFDDFEVNERGVYITRSAQGIVAHAYLLGEDRPFMVEEFDVDITGVMRFTLNKLSNLDSQVQALIRGVNRLLLDDSGDALFLFNHEIVYLVRKRVISS